MKDINLVIEVLKEHDISQAEYARAIGSTRQSVTNWKTLPDGIPKKFIMPTILFLKKHTGKTIKAEKLLSYLQPNTTKKTDNKAIING